MTMYTFKGLFTLFYGLLYRNKLHLTLIYPAHFEDVPCQSEVNHIFDGWENYVSRQGIYHCKEERLSFIKKQTEIQIYK